MLMFILGRRSVVFSFDLFLGRVCDLTLIIPHDLGFCLVCTQTCVLARAGRYDHGTCFVAENIEDIVLVYIA